MAVIGELKLNELEHYGVLGMKWGVRKDGKPQGYQYGKNQRKRDKQVYGKRGSKRIEKRLKKGDSISIARGEEAKRRDKITGRNKYTRQVGKLVGAGAAIAAVNVLISQLTGFGETGRGMLLANKFLKDPMALKRISEIINTPQFRVAASAGAAKIGEMLSGDIAVKARLKAHGYDPNRKY